MSEASTNMQALARIATADVDSGRAIGAKLRALLILADAVERSPLPRSRLRSELQSVVATELLGGRQLEAAVRAVEAMEQLDAPAPVRPRQLDPESTAPPTYWHPGDGWEELDRFDTVATRDRWRLNVERFMPESRA